MKRLLAQSRMLVPILAALSVGAVTTTSADGAAFAVSSLADSGAGTLRQAITDANAAPGADTVSFGLGGTITLASTLPPISDAAGLTISGTGQSVVISGNSAVVVMQVATGALLALNDLTIANGNGGGGGLSNSGTVTITNSTFSGNSAPGSFGGAINSGGGSTLNVTNSSFAANSATGGFGGAIYSNSGTVTVTNSTFSGNSATGGFGAAVFNNGVGGVTLRNTIVTNSVGTGNCSGAIANGGNNIDSAATCGWGSASGSMSSTDPLIGPLANNGGPTQTFALLAGSPAINGVSFGAPNSAPATDQRGTARPQGTAFDIGAYEFAVVVAALPPVATPTVNVWALMLFILFAGLISVRYTSRN